MESSPLGMDCCACREMAAPASVTGCFIYSPLELTDRGLSLPLHPPPPLTLPRSQNPPGSTSSFILDFCLPGDCARISYLNPTFVHPLDPEHHPFSTTLFFPPLREVLAKLVHFALDSKRLLFRRLVSARSYQRGRTKKKKKKRRGLEEPWLDGPFQGW